MDPHPTGLAAAIERLNRDIAGQEINTCVSPGDLRLVLDHVAREPERIQTHHSTCYRDPRHHACAMRQIDDLRAALGIPEGEDAVAFVERTAIEECCNPQEPSLGWWPVSGTGAKRGGWPIRRRLALPEAKP